MTYAEFLEELQEHAEEDFATFQKRLIFTQAKILGVRTPTLRKLAKKYAKNVDELMNFPDEYYEVTFVKLCAVSLLKYEEFLLYIDRSVALIDNWATCDTFKPKCLIKRKDEFLPYIEKFFSQGGEFYERYALVTLLFYYIEEKYLPMIADYISRADTGKYYVHMATAWLVAEILVKFPEKGKEILKSGVLPPKTHNKAIQKAKESFRVKEEEKEYLNSLKIKNV